LKAELKEAREEIRCADMLLKKQGEMIDNSDAWREELTTRVNQKLFEALRNVYAGIETMRFEGINLIEPARQAMSEMHFTLTIMGRMGEIDIQDVPTTDFEDV